MKSPAIKAALMMALSSSLLLGGYEVVRSASYSLFKASYGAEGLPIIMALLPFFMLPALMGYDKLLGSLGPRKTLVCCGLASALGILGCYGAISQDVTVARGLLLLLSETYAVLMVEQFWSFINSSLTQNEAKKYNGLILTISTCGAIVGGTCVHLLAEQLGTTNLLLLTVGMTLPALALAERAFGLHTPAWSPAKKEKVADSLGLSLLRENKALVMILGIVIASQVYGTALTLNFQSFLADAYPNLDKQTAISGLFFASLNLASIFLQLVVSPWLLATVPIIIIHASIPLVHIAALIVAIIFPSFASVALAYMLFKSLDYSLFRAAKEILYIPLSFDARYRTKELIDVFGYRFSKSGASLAIFVGQKFGMVFSSFSYLWIGLSATSLWLGFLVPLMRRRALQTAEDGKA